MVEFTYLKLTGFKSFAEPQDLGVAPGLTGIVGPNGCGKSNIVEAVRWLMGESSARAVRGDDFDDIIFAGTSARPARNFAEVIMHINNGNGHIAEYADTPILEIARRLERGKASSYTINSKPVLARDVQLLFADLGTSARSHSIISQGQVTQLITAKPVDRYGLLMDAANTRGLQQRRGEATRRLNTAETNLLRIDDILTAMGDQKQELAKQARQASRYRSINDRIRKAEARLFYFRYRQEDATLATARDKERALVREVAAATDAASKAMQKKDAAAETLPALRQADAESAAKQQRFGLEMRAIDNEEANLKNQTRDETARLDQVKADIAHETQQADDAAAMQSGLQKELTALTQSEADHTPRIQTASEALAAARAESNKADKGLATAAAALGAADHTQATLEARRVELGDRQASLEKEIASLDIKGATEAVKTADQQLADADKLAKTAHKTSSEANGAADKCRTQSQTANQTASNAETDAMRMRAEIDTLAGLLAGGDGKAKSGDASIATHLTIPDGLEMAVAAVLAESLMAGIGKGDMFWRTDLPAFTTATLTPPSKSAALLTEITAPPALQRALVGVGIVADAKTAAAMQGDLLPGQMLTTKQGGLWRWDGFVRLAGVDGASERLRYSKRLQQLTASVDAAEAKAQTAGDHAEACADRLKQAEATQAAARQAESDAQTALLAATSQAEQSQARLTAEEAKHASLTATLAEVGTALKKLTEELAGLPSRPRLSADHARHEKLAEAARTRLTAAIATHTSISKEHELRASRRQEKENELQKWRDRLTASQTRLTEFANRQGASEKALADLATRPAALQKKRDGLAAEIAGAESAKQKSGDALARAETALRKAETASREAEAALRAKREALIAQKGETQMAESNLARTAGEIAEKLSVEVAELPDLIGQQQDKTDDAAATDEAALRNRTERLYRERDALGAVNLTAETEMEKLDAEIAKLTADQTDIRAAISKLRDGIAKINKEGRARLRRSFADVNRHFATLFQTLFDGGEATLVLTDSDDPLVAGLEVMASPPGKRLQSLGLLSGGEQALTALALVFSVFLTNPAPICILDEVDAALDDTNVARFCHLLAELTEATKTRFVIITHHRMTMAKMHRLYGVTMQQPGVSNIVSVDLMEAEKYQAEAV